MSIIYAIAAYNIHHAGLRERDQVTMDKET